MVGIESNILRPMVRSFLEYLWHQAASYNNRIVENLLEYNPQARVLDLGCHTGILCRSRVDRKIKTSDIYGIDVHADSITSCRALGIKAIKHDLNKRLPFQKNYFDCIIANQIIEHVL